MENQDIESSLSKSTRSYVIKHMQKLQDKGYKIIIRGSDYIFERPRIKKNNDNKP